MKKRVFSAITGILLLAGCAVYVAVTAFGQNDIFSTTLRGWWVLFFIIPGIMGMFQKGSRLFSFGLILFGAGLFCNTRQWFGLIDPVPDIKWWQMAFAVIMLLCGIGFIRMAFGKKKKYIPERISIDGDTINISTKHSHKHSDSCAQDEHTAVFSNNTLNYNGKEFRGIVLNGVFGTAVLDLRGSTVPENCTIEADSIFGSIVIYDGNNANFDITKNVVFGSVSDAPTAHDPELPTITVIANSVFGSVEIK